MQGPQVSLVNSRIFCSFPNGLEPSTPPDDADVEDEEPEELEDIPDCPGCIPDDIPDVELFDAGAA